jgi:hypothetical protein
MTTRRPELLATDLYRKQHPGTLDRICNGCGPDSWHVDLIPDSIFGVSVSAACDIHDFDYWVGGDATDRWHADLRLLGNMRLLINAAHSHWWQWPLTAIRLRLCHRYFQAVRRFGIKHFMGDDDAKDF